MIEAIARWSVRHRLAVMINTMIFVVIGVVFATYLRFDALPDVTGTQVLVLTTAPGFTPEEVERLVTRRVEMATSGLPNGVEQRSISRYGLSAVTIVFEPGTDLLRARQVVAERLTRVAAELPPGVDAPEIGPMTGGLGEIYQFSLGSDRRAPAELLEIADRDIAPRLRTVGGVVEVNTWGGARRTLSVDGDPVRMARRRVTLRELAAATERAVGAAAGASLPAGESHVLLRGVALPTAPSDLAAALVHTDPDGSAVRIADVATVSFGAEPRIGAATEGGRGEVVYVMVQMLTGANALEVLSRLHDRLPEVRAALPPDVIMTEAYDRSDLVLATLKTVGLSLLEGGVLIILVLLAMLGSGRAGALVASVIPLSMLGAVIAMVLLEVPGNLMSLGALDFGLLVDGAVVVVEAIFHQFRDERGNTPVDVSARIAEVTASIARPVFYSVSIILLVYVPVLTLEGVEGTMFRPMAVTVVTALTTALFLSLTYVPALASYVLRPAHVPTRDPLFPRLFERAYEPALRWALQHPRLVVAVAIVSLAGGLVAFGRAGTTFIPQLDEGDLVIQTTRHADIGLGAAIEQAGELERAIAGVPEVVRATSRIGSPTVATDTMGIEQADVFVSLRPRSEWRRGLSHERLVDDLERRIRAVQPGVDLAFTQPIQMRFNEMVGGAVTDVSVSVFGEDLDEIRHLATRYAEALEAVPGAVDVRVTSPPGIPVLEVRPRFLDAALLGFDATDVLDVVRAQRTGLLAGVTFDGFVRVPVRVRVGDVRSAFDAQHAMVPTERGSVIPLGAIADLDLHDAPALVSHDEAARRVVIGFNVRDRDLGSVVEEAQAKVAEIGTPRGYRLAWGGQYASLERARARLLVVIPVVLVLILGLLYRVFGSVRSSLAVFLNVPFAAIGGMFALAARGMPVSISAAVGFIALSGIAVLNGVVLVARIQAEEESGATVAEAAQRAARARLRPVLMTALVAGLGFVPMMLARGVGAEVQAPLATVVVGGLVTSTLLTLLVLPAIYPRLVGTSAGATGEAREETKAEAT